ncbi:MAG: DUF5131 family protein [bacterium]|nr:DUF5131 family protein [bacterium]
MAEHSVIEQTETTWNPTTGCARTSPSRDHCYALAKRLKSEIHLRYDHRRGSRCAVRRHSHPSPVRERTSSGGGSRWHVRTCC